jgi:hypothetical protein
MIAVNRKELPIPPLAANNQAAAELIRVWSAQGKQRVSIATNVWKDPAAWGIMLVDLAKHIANSYEQTQNMGSESALARIREGFDAEWGFPTDRPSGKVGD